MSDKELLNVKAVVWRRWWRVAIYWGSPPGTHRGFWRTDTGVLTGWNWRKGRFTAFIHTRRSRPSDRLR